MEQNQSSYPATLTIDYPARALNKLTTFFRPFLAIPIFIVLALISGSNSRTGWWFGAGGVLFAPTILMLLFRQKYPRWWFDWNVALTKLSTRISTYLLLMTDHYPSVEDEQSVHIDIPYPDASKLSNGMPLIKWFLAIPHYIVLAALGFAVAVCVIIAWFAILFSGKYPKSIFDFIVGVMRWSLRVTAYAILLTTDQYPPFSME